MRDRPGPHDPRVLTDDLLAVRADADEVMGSGHVMRCLALGQAWRAAGGSVIFLSASLPPSIRHRLQEEQMQVVQVAAARGSDEDIGETIRFLQALDPAWLAVDGYHLGPSFAELVRRRASLNVLLWDDVGFDHPADVDVVLNQNVFATSEMYPTTSARKLLGPRYVCLRDEFFVSQPRPRDFVLVTFGGSPPPGPVRLVSEALAILGEGAIDAFLVGGHLSGTMHPLPEGLRLIEDVPNMAALMQRAVVAVSAAGSTCWELCYLGVPQLLLVLSANQRRIAASLDGAGCAIDLGTPDDAEPAVVAEQLRGLLNDESIRGSMTARGRSLIDGRGRDRVVHAMMDAG